MYHPIPNPVLLKSRASQIIKVWSGHPEFQLADVPLDDFKTLYQHLAHIMGNLQAREIELLSLRNEQDETLAMLNAACLRVHNGMESHFGPDSPEIAGMGGPLSRPGKRSGARAAAPGDAWNP